MKKPARRTKVILLYNEKTHSNLDSTSGHDFGCGVSDHSK
jgi:hypothetical protein